MAIATNIYSSNSFLFFKYLIFFFSNLHSYRFMESWYQPQQAHSENLFQVVL